MEFGPRLRIPRDERLQKHFPNVAPETIHSWIDEFKRFDSLIWKVAEEGADSAYSSTEMISIFREQFPDYDNTSFSLAWQRANYYAWHEGYVSNKRKNA
jgi:hypothetical protein